MTEMARVSSMTGMNRLTRMAGMTEIIWMPVIYNWM